MHTFAHTRIHKLTHTSHCMYMYMCVCTCVCVWLLWCGVLQVWQLMRAAIASGLQEFVQLLAEDLPTVCTYAWFLVSVRFHTSGAMLHHCLVMSSCLCTCVCLCLSDRMRGWDQACGRMCPFTSVAVLTFVCLNGALLHDCVTVHVCIHVPVHSVSTLSTSVS